MDRRAFVLGLAGLAVSSVKPRALPSLQSVAVTAPKIVKQECPNWCWAAVASMIFDNLGHQVDQATIVEKIYNGPFCATAQPPMVSAVLNSPWVDENNQVFFPKVEAAFDQVSGVDDITDSLIIDELKHNRLLLYANTHHCMAIAGADYIEAASGPKIVNTFVIDPWPGRSNWRPLGADGLRPVSLGGRMAYLAAVRL